MCSVLYTPEQIRPLNRLGEPSGALLVVKPFVFFCRQHLQGVVVKKGCTYSRKSRLLTTYRTRLVAPLVSTLSLYYNRRRLAPSEHVGTTFRAFQCLSQARIVGRRLGRLDACDGRPTARNIYLLEDGPS